MPSQTPMWTLSLLVAALLFLSCDDAQKDNAPEATAVEAAPKGLTLVGEHPTEPHLANTVLILETLLSMDNPEDIQQKLDMYISGDVTWHQPEVHNTSLAGKESLYPYSTSDFDKQYPETAFVPSHILELSDDRVAAIGVTRGPGPMGVKTAYVFHFDRDTTTTRLASVEVHISTLIAGIQTGALPKPKEPIDALAWPTETRIVRAADFNAERDQRARAFLTIYDNRDAVRDMLHPDFELSTYTAGHHPPIRADKLMASLDDAIKKMQPIGDQVSGLWMLEDGSVLALNTSTVRHVGTWGGIEATMRAIETRELWWFQFDDSNKLLRAELISDASPKIFTLGILPKDTRASDPSWRPVPQGKAVRLK